MSASPTSASPLCRGSESRIIRVARPVWFIRQPRCPHRAQTYTVSLRDAGHCCSVRHFPKFSYVRFWIWEQPRHHSRSYNDGAGYANRGTVYGSTCAPCASLSRSCHCLTSHLIHAPELYYRLGCLSTLQCPVETVDNLAWQGRLSLPPPPKLPASSAPGYWGSSAGF